VPGAACRVPGAGYGVHQRAGDLTISPPFFHSQFVAVEGLQFEAIKVLQFVAVDVHVDGQ
jgi:hypothetical protein